MSTSTTSGDLVILVGSRGPLVRVKGPLVGPSSVTSAAQQGTSKACYFSKTEVALVVEEVLQVRCSCSTIAPQLSYYCAEMCH